MRRRWIKLSALALSAVLLLAGCRARVQESDLTGRTYKYEKDGFGGSFTIRLKEGHEFSYYEGGLSSHIGTGTWSLDGDVLTLSEPRFEGPAAENHFRVDGALLVFQAEGSDGFFHVEIADGEAFIALAEDAPPSAAPSRKSTAPPGVWKT